MLLIPAPFVNRRRLVPYVPYGLLSLQALANEHGSKVDILGPSEISESVFESSEELAESIAGLVPRHEYQAVGLSTMCSSFHHSLGVALSLKRRYPELEMWLGGPHASLGPSLILERFPEIDAVFVGEGEATFEEMLVRLQETPDSPLPDLPGVATRRSPFVPRQSISNMDELPFVDQAAGFLFSVGSSKDRSSRGIPLEAERGCTGRCTFCSTSPYWGDRVRYKSERRLIAEMDRLRAATGNRRFSLIGDNMAASPRQLLAFCEEMRRESSEYWWSCSLTPDRLRIEDLDLLWTGGCRSMFVGVESGSQVTLERIRKRLDLNWLVEFLREAIEKGFVIHTSFIIGFPWETSSDLDNTLKLHLELLQSGVAYSNVDTLCPLPGTDLERSHGDQIQPGKGDSATAVDDLPCGDEATAIMERCPELFRQLGRFETENVDPIKVRAAVQAARLISNHYSVQRKSLPWDEEP